MGKIKNLLKSRKFWKYTWLTLFLIATGVLIGESCVEGTASANQSNVVGGGLADIINDIGGDQSELIEPTSVSINKTNLNGSYNVGESVTLSVTVSPAETSFTSILFESNNTDVATVSSAGTVSFRKSGSATITVKSEYNTNLSDSVTFNVLDIYPTDVSARIKCASDNNIYQLTVGNSYTISTTITPSNASVKEVSYSCNEAAYSNYFALSQDGKITANSPSNGNSYEIIVSAKSGPDTSISTSINITINNVPEVITYPVEDILVSRENISIGVNESKSITSLLSVTFQPSNATNKSYTVSSSDSSVVSVSGKTIRGVKEGTATLTIQSSANPSASKTVEVTVNWIPLTSEGRISVSGGNVFYKGSSYTINHSGATSNYSYRSASGNKIYRSSNPHIVSFASENSSRFTCNNITSKPVTLYLDLYDKDSSDGEAYVKYTLEYTISSIVDPATSEVNDFEYRASYPSYTKISENADFEATFFLEDEYNLSSIFTFSRFTKDGSSVDSQVASSHNSAISFYLNNGSESVNTIKGTDLGLEPGINTIHIRNFPNSDEKYIDKEVKILFINKVSINSVNNSSYTAPTNTNSLLLSKYFDLGTIEVSGKGVNTDVTFASSAGTNQTLNLSIYNNSNAISFSSDVEGINAASSTFSFISNSGGNNYYIIITPFYGSYEATCGYAIRINIDYTEATGVQFKLFNSNNDELATTELDDGTLVYGAGEENFYTPGTKFTFSTAPTNSNASYYNFEVRSLNEDILKVENDEITALKAGEGRIQITDSVSGKIEKYFTIRIKNRISINTESPFEFTRVTYGTEITVDKETNTLGLKKGYSYKIKVNLDESSTYTDIVYSSSDPDGLYIGQDGSITAINEGDYQLKATISDSFEYSQHAELTLNIHVSPLDLIENVNAFIYQIRKGLGHFGAFMALGICSTMFFMLITDKKKWLFLIIPANIATGFAISGLTELIQYFVPGRAGVWSDVWLDFEGFCAAAIVITSIFLIVYLVQYLRKRNKEKKMKQSDENN